MTAYKYKGIDPAGQRIEGRITALSLDEAERKVGSQGLTILSIVPAEKSSGKESSVAPASTPTAPVIGARKKVSEADAGAILRNLAVMAETGVPFAEAIEASIQSARTPAIVAAMSDVRDALIAGQSLSGSMRAAPQMFPTIIVDMVRVAETGGKLDQALANGASYLERRAELKRKVTNAMMYPMVMLAVSIATIFILVVVVMPKFSQVFESMKAELPIVTKVMLSSGAMIRGNPIGSAIGAVGIFIGLFFLLKQEPVQRVLGRFISRLPVVGELIKRLALARSLQSIATLSASNVPLLVAIEQGAKVAGEPRVHDALMQVRNEIEQGKSMSESMLNTGVFPKNVVQMVGVGERTGRLPVLLETLCRSMEEDIDARLKATVALVEPLMIVTMGAIVGSITMSIIGPIYSVVEKIR